MVLMNRSGITIRQRKKWMSEISDSSQGIMTNNLHDNDNRTVWKLLRETKVLKTVGTMLILDEIEINYVKNIAEKNLGKVLCGRG